MPSAIVGAVVGLVNHQQNRRAQRATNTQNAIANSNELNNNRASRRTAARKARIARARIRQSAENTGALGSSLITAAGAITQELSTNIALQESNQKAAEGITKQGQIVASARSKAGLFTTLGEIAQGALDLRKKSQG